MKTYLIIIGFLFSNLIALAQVDSIPLELTREYFAGELRNRKSILIDEAKEQNFNPNKLPQNVYLNFKVLLLTENKAVVATEIAENKDTTDIYLFWTKSNDWKITSFRALWLPGMFYAALEPYKDLDENGLKVEYEKIFSEAKKSNDTITDKHILEAIGPFEDFKYEIENMKLTVASDRALVNHFSHYQTKFDALLIKIQSENLNNNDNWRYDTKTSFKKDIQELLISSVSKYSDDGYITFTIGGMIDNSVGYLYCNDPKCAPLMNEERYIMIRNLGNGWYLFKTT